MQRVLFTGLERDDETSLLGLVPDGRPYAEWTSRELVLWEVAKDVFHRYKIRRKAYPLRRERCPLWEYFELPHAVVADSHEIYRRSRVIADGLLWSLAEEVAGVFSRGCAVKFEFDLRPVPDTRALYFVYFRVENRTLRRKRVKASTKATVAFLWCLSRQSATPKDVDQLLARTLWTTRLQEEWEGTST
jgi:hypothetical protein